MSSRLLLAGALALLLTSFVRGQTTQEEATAPTEAVSPATQEITPELIETRSKAAAEAADVDADGKKRLAELYRQASELVQRTKNYSAKSADFKTRAEQAGDKAVKLKSDGESLQKSLAEANTRLAEVNRRLENRRYVPAQELGQLEQDHAAKEKALKSLKDELAKIEDASIRANRRKEIRSRLAAIEAELADIDVQLAASPPADENTNLTLARRTELLARKQAITKERPALEGELAAYDAEDAVDKTRLERDLKTQQVAAATVELQISDLLLKRKKAAAALEQVRTARDDFEEYASSPFLKPLAEGNFQYSEQNQAVTKQFAEAQSRLSVDLANLEDLTKKFASIRRKVESVGLPASVGAMLRKERTDLPDITARRAALRERQSEIEEAQLLLFDLDEERSKLANLEKALEQYVEQAESNKVPADMIESNRDRAAELLESRKEILDRLIRNQENLFDALAEHSITEQQLIQSTEQFADYIDKRVLWIRSGQSLLEGFKTKEARKRTWENYEDGFARLASPTNWINLGRSLVNDARSRPEIYLGFFLLCGLLIRMAVTCRKRIYDIGHQVQHGAFSQFAPTLEVALLTAYIATPWPILIGFLGWRVGLAANVGEIGRGLGMGLQLSALGYFSLEFFRQIFRRHGLAESHFAWNDSAVQLLRRNLRWLMLIGLPTVLLTALAHVDDVAPGRNSLERLFFIAGTVMFAVFVARILHPRSGIFQQHIALHASGWLARLRFFWYGSAVASPLALAILILVGYHYTAQQLAWRIYLTIALLAGLLVVYSLVNRLLLVHRRRLSIEQARQRRAAAAAAREAEAEAGGSDPVPIQVLAENVSIEETLADLRTQTSQTRRLLSTATLGLVVLGLWLTWSDVVPALGFLERWPLWQSTSTKTEIVVDDAGNVVIDEDGNVQRRTRDEVDSITIADLIFAIFIVIVTIVAARNLPGLLEISVLQQLPLESSVRYAITTLCSYGILLIGLILSCKMIGLHWNQVQWMATALTFGLAFGLQEMFANFVAGIIILFERPIRVGDIVTIDSITGVVSRVRIRATTITDYDRKDFVVPNKDFITGRILNWTLSDQVNRITLDVGIAYGSDTNLAKQILLRITQEHPLVVDDPPPQATFEQFGESSLLIRLRTFISMRDMSSRLKIIDDLHSTIDAEFKQANIEIAFPQRDLHVRSFTPPVNVESPSAGLLSKDTGSPSQN